MILINLMSIEFIAENNDGNIISKLYYSIGGGFIQSDDDLDSNEIQVRFKFNSAKELLEIANSRNYKIHELIQENEKQYNSLNDDELKSKILDLWSVMNKSIYNGMQNTGKIDIQS